MTISLLNKLLRQNSVRENKNINLKKRENFNKINLTTTIAIYNIFNISRSN